MKSWKKPTPDLVDRTVPKLIPREQQVYFFRHLKNPHWLEPLRDKGFLTHPPTPIVHNAEGTISFPAWPASEYLKRMAEYVPEKVCEIILTIKETDNPYVHNDFVQAALAMPPEIANRLIEKACTWVHKKHVVFPEKIGDLIVHLAHGKQVDSALRLARNLLDITKNPRPVSPELADLYPSYRHEAVSRINEWEYGQILEKHIPQLVIEIGFPVLELLCDLLGKAIQLGKWREEKGQSDYSYIWRETIEGSGGTDRLRNYLVSAARDSAIILMKSFPKKAAEILGLLESRQFHVFQRIALYLLYHLPELDTEMIANRITDRKLFDEVGVRHEYFHLSKKHFGNLSSKTREKVFEWISAGLDRMQVKKRENFIGRALTEEEIAGIIDHWRLERLTPLKEYLPSDWGKKYNQLVKQYKEPVHPDLPSHISGGGWVGPKSPKTDQELKEMPVRELIDFIGTWQPPKEMFAPSPEGLGRQIITVVGENPGVYSKNALAFKNLDPTYVRAVIQGFKQGCKTKNDFHWEPVLDFCLWAVSQTREIPDRNLRVDDADPDWGWTRKACADLLSIGFEAKETSIPFELRDAAWSILEPILSDPDPTPEYEKQYGGGKPDPLTMSINTARGEAMHALIKYALWCHRNLSKSNEEKLLNFDFMPEVRTVLEEHLDPIIDPSLAIRSVYGQWLPWLVFLDANWVKSQLKQLFPQKEEFRPLWEAMWETYVVVNSAYDNVFDILQEQYARAIGEIGRAREGRRLPGDPDEHLAGHLMHLYGRGKIMLNDGDHLLTSFFAQADDEIRSHAISFIGRSVEASKEEIPKNVIERFVNLWNQRIKEAESNPGEFIKEMAAFGWWFESGKFDDEWALVNLEKSLQLSGGQIEPKLHAAKRLVELASVYPHQVILCTKMLIDADRNGWDIMLWGEDIGQILELTFQGDDPEGSKIARDLINELGRRGFHDYRDLL